GLRQVNSCTHDHAACPEHGRNGSPRGTRSFKSFQKQRARRAGEFSDDFSRPLRFAQSSHDRLLHPWRSNSDKAQTSEKNVSGKGGSVDEYSWVACKPDASLSPRIFGGPTSTYRDCAGSCP